MISKVCYLEPLKGPAERSAEERFKGLHPKIVMAIMAKSKNSVKSMPNRVQLFVKAKGHFSIIPIYCTSDML